MNERAGAGLVCARCGYVLKGLSLDAVCPECAFPVVRSLPGGLLKRMDAFELTGVRARLGEWCAALILVGLVSAAGGVACPAIAGRAGVMTWWAAEQVVGGAVMLVAACAWLPLMALRAHTSNKGLRRSAVWAGAALWISAVSACMGPLASGAVDDPQTGRARWAVVWVVLGVLVLTRVAQGVFFVLGTRFTRAVAQGDESEGGRHRLAAGLALAGATVRLCGDVVAVERVWRWAVGLGVSEDALGWVVHGATTSGGLLLAGACALWTGACGRVERRIALHIDTMESDRLKEQLEGRS